MLLGIAGSKSLIYYVLLEVTGLKIVIGELLLGFWDVLLLFYLTSLMNLLQLIRFLLCFILYVFASLICNFTIA